LKLNLKKMSETKKALTAAGAVLLVAFVVALVQDKDRSVDLNTSGAVNGRGSEFGKSVADLAKDSDIVILGSVVSAQASYRTNNLGDQLIYTSVKIKVEESLKGNAGQSMDVEMVGGTVGDTTLRVSHTPEPLKANEMGALFLKRGSDGKMHINGEDGLLKLKDGNYKNDFQEMRKDELKQKLNASN
jgi:hypothetical protein